MKSFFSRIWRWRFVRFIVWTLGTLVTLYALLCSYVNYIGGKRWAEAQAKVRQEGETLDIHELFSDPIPESTNYCAIPPLQDIAMIVDNDTSKGEPGARRKRLDEAALPSGSKIPGLRPKAFQSASLGVPADLKQWAEWLRKEGSMPTPDTGDAARDVLAALSRNDALVGELAAGLNRTEAQWTPEWKTRPLPGTVFTIALPQYGVTQHMTPMLNLRTTAAARAGNAAKAHESLLISLRFAQASLRDPFIIGTLVASMDAAQACSGIWEVCDAQAGSAEDFTRLELSLAKLDFLAGTLRAFRGEMAGAINAIEWMKPHRDPRLFYMMSAIGENRPHWGTALAMKCSPTGLLDLNAALLVDLSLDYNIKPLAEGGIRAALRKQKELELILKEGGSVWRPGSLIAYLTMPATMTVTLRTAYTQCQVDEARIACALERYRIEKGSYPDSLDAVKLADGKPLPKDVVTQQPIHYRKTPNGKYALWCVGLDGKDDGGKRMVQPDKNKTIRPYDAKYAGDWVWDFPAK